MGYPFASRADLGHRPQRGLDFLMVRLVQMHGARLRFFACVLDFFVSLRDCMGPPLLCCFCNRLPFVSV